MIKNSYNGLFSSNNKFIVYEHCPYVFQAIRSSCSIKTEHYQRSVGPENMLGYLLLGYLLLGYLDSMQELGS